MGTKLIENIVLIIGLLVVGSAVFLMYFDDNGTAAKSINIVFSIGSYNILNPRAGEARGLVPLITKLCENYTETV